MLKPYKTLDKARGHADVMIIQEVTGKQTYILILIVGRI
jgi:hypothetical protein